MAVWKLVRFMSDPDDPDEDPDYQQSQAEGADSSSELD